MNKTNTNTFLTGIDQKKNVKSQLIKRNLNKKEFLYKSKSSEQIIKENLFNFLIDGFKEYKTKFFPFGTNKYCEFGEKLFFVIIEELIGWDIFILFLN